MNRIAVIVIGSNSTRSLCCDEAPALSHPMRGRVETRLLLHLNKENPMLTVRPAAMGESVVVRFRVANPYYGKYLSCYVDGERISHRKKQIMAPGEMESFTQFASDLDESTAKLLSYGQGLMRMLRQKQFHPYKQYEQVILLVAGLNHVFQEIVPEQLDAFIPALLQHFGETQGALCNAIEQTGQLSDDQQSQIIECAKEFVQSYFSK